MRRIFFDTEFTDFPWTGRSELFWVGLCDESGKIYSAINADVDLSDCSEFVRTRILPMIGAGEPRLSAAALASVVREFCEGVSELWAWQPSVQDLIGYGFDLADAAALHAQYADWDLQLIRALTGETAPPWRHCHDLHRLADDTNVTLPPNPIAHHPGFDAAWGRQVFLTATGHQREDRR
jgi:hypothetical protein